VAERVNGAQLGLVNVGRRVRGVQLGLVNVSEDIDGMPLGLLSVSRKTRLSALAWANNIEIANLSLKVVTGYAYTQYGLGLRTSPTAYVVDVGLGAHVPIGRFYVEPGVHFGGVVHVSTEPDGAPSTATRDRSAVDALSWPYDYGTLTYRTALGFAVTEQFGAFVGAGARHAPERSEVRFTYFAGISLF
jgi:hypothetical protein